jgi:drug/metabolite transporter (DMT)-like permease
MSKRNAPLAHAPRRAGGDWIAGNPDRSGQKGAGPARSASLVAWVCLLIVWVVWGSTYLFIRIGVETMPPLLMAAARNLVAGLIMFPLALFSRSPPGRFRGASFPRRSLLSPLASRRPLRPCLPSSLLRRSSVQAGPAPFGSRGVAPRSSRRRGPSARGGGQAAPRPSGSLGLRWPTRAEWLGCAIVGILLLVANGVVGVGEKTVPSGLAALLIATVPLWLLGIDAGLNHARLGLAPLAGLALGLAGVALLSGLGGGSHGISVVGVVTILAAAAAWALGTIMAGRVTIPSSPALASGMQLLAGGTALLILAASAGEFSSLRLAQVSTRSWLALAYLIVVGSIVAFSAYGIAVRTLPTPTVATYAYVNPVIAVLLGALVLNERLTPAMIGGGVLIVGAVVLVVRRSPPAH